MEYIGTSRVFKMVGYADSSHKIVIGVITY